MRSIGVLLVRLVVGGLLAGHGAQKLFGAFGGAGMEGTAGFLESKQLRPGTVWAPVAGGSEFFGGLLTLLGFLNPMGPVLAMGAMFMAWAKVHLGKPVWATQGGAELPLTNLAVLSALTLAGPGRLSVDGLLGIRLPRWIGAAALAGMFGALWMGAREELEQGAQTIAEGAQSIADSAQTIAQNHRELVGVFDSHPQTDDSADRDQDGSFPASDPASMAQPATLTPDR